MNVYDTLMKAADLIEERGWNGVNVSQDQWGMKPGSPLCLEGAIFAAVGRRGLMMTTPCEIANTCPAGAAVREYLDMGPWTLDGDRLYNWNDTIGRTATEVIEVLRAAAAVSLTREPAAQEAVSR